MGTFLRNTIIVVVLLSLGVWGVLNYLRNDPLPPAAEVPQAEKAPNVFLVTPETDTVINYEGLTLEIPAGSVDEDTEIVVTKTHDHLETNNVTDEFDIKPEGLTFNHWVKLSMPFYPSAISPKAPIISLEYELLGGHITKLPFSVDRQNERIETMIREL